MAFAQGLGYPRRMEDFDTTWFRRRLDAIGKSQRAWAQVLNVDPSSITELLNRRRRLQIAEVGPTATFLEVSPWEVMFRTGAPWARPVDLVVSYTVSEGGIVQLIEAGASNIEPTTIGVSAEMVGAEAGLVLDDSMAPRVRAGEYIVFQRVDFAAVDRMLAELISANPEKIELEVVAAVKDGPIRFGLIMPGGMPGRYTVASLRSGGPLFFGVELDWVAAVLWIKPRVASKPPGDEPPA